MNKLNIITMTMEILSIGEEYGVIYSPEKVESIIDYIEETINNGNPNYDVDAWLEETEMNYPEFLISDI